MPHEPNGKPAAISLMSPNPAPASRALEAELRGHARSLRTHLPGAEARLWHPLRNLRLLDLKFSHQVPVGPALVDFICHTHRPIIAADGHPHADQTAYAPRDQGLKQHGYKMLRFPEQAVPTGTDAVLTQIRDTIRPT